MRLREALLKAATLLVVPGCADGSRPMIGCPTAAPPPPSPVVAVDAALACAIASEDHFYYGTTFQDDACSRACNASDVDCGLPASYVEAFRTASQPVGWFEPGAGDASTEAGAVDGGDAGSLPAGCPAVAASITVTCTAVDTCIGGRRTEGFAARNGAASDGERLASMAWLEAVSVHAFERLERELEAHGAPPALRREARRARRDEVRHTAMTTRLARRRGVAPAVPEKPATMRVRALVDVAIENAVEGCVRETYGALLAFVEALSSPDPSLRRAMRSIAEDECRHAELAWAVHAWALPRLRPAERKRVEDALRGAAREVPAWTLLTIDGPLS